MAHKSEKKKKKGGSKNCLCDQMLDLTEYDLQSSHYKYVQRTKATIIKEVKKGMI